MRESKTLKKLRSGGYVLCTQIGSGYAPFCAMAAQQGFDCVWLDMEHKPVEETALRECILAATLYDCDTVVRIRKRGYLDYFRPLEDGATGVMVPHCRSLAEAKEAVRNTKFYPIGLRGMDFTGLSGDYMTTPGEVSVAHALEQTFTMLQIEDVEVLKDLPEIVALAGVDLLFVGPADLKQSALAQGVYHEGFLDEVYARLTALTEKTPNVFWGTTVGSAEAAKAVYDRGGRFLSIRGDFGLVLSGLQSLYGDAERLLSPKAPL